MNNIHVNENSTNREILQQTELPKAHKCILEERHQMSPVHLWTKKNIIALHQLLII